MIANPHWNDARQAELLRLMAENGKELDAVERTYSVPEEMRLARERLFAVRSPLTRESEQPLVSLLRDGGFPVESVYDFVNRRCDYDGAFPTLVEELDRPYPPIIREGIARSLGCRSAAPFWDRIVDRYRKEARAPSDVQSAKQGLAIAATEACPEERLDELMEILRDVSLGSSRILMLDRLWRARKGAFRSEILALASDSDLTKEIARKRKALEKAKKRNDN